MRIYKNNLFFKIVLLMLMFFSPQQLMAARPNAGGGDIEEFDTGKFITSTVISLGSLYVGNAISSGMNASSVGAKGYGIAGNFVGVGKEGVATFGQGFSNSLSGLGSLSGFANNLSTTIVLQQVGSAVGAIGSYYDWNPKTTLFVSSVAQSMAGGMMDTNSAFSVQGPGGTLIGGQLAVNDGLLTRAMLGATKGAIEGGILTAFADSKGNVSPWVGPLANLTGSFGTGMVAGGLTSDKGKFSWNNINNFNWEKGFSQGISRAEHSIPNIGVQLGVNYATEGMKRQDADIVRGAFLGAYPVANALANLHLPKEIDYSKQQAAQQAAQQYNPYEKMRSRFSAIMSPIMSQQYKIGPTPPADYTPNPPLDLGRIYYGNELNNDPKDVTIFKENR